MCTVQDDRPGITQRNWRVLHGDLKKRIQGRLAVVTFYQEGELSGLESSHGIYSVNFFFFLII